MHDCARVVKVATTMPGCALRLTAALRALLVALLVLSGLSAGASVQAQERVWRLAKWSGPVTLRVAGGAEGAPAEGAVAGPGDRVATGPGGRVLLTRGADSIVMSENTVVEVPAASDQPTPTILQDRGEATFQVEKRPNVPFVVETPHLAAAVKGTEFVVTAQGPDSKVYVRQGVVEVADFRSGQFAAITAKQFANSATESYPGLLIGGEGTLPIIRQGVARKASTSVDQSGSGDRLNRTTAARVIDDRPVGWGEAVVMRSREVAHNLGIDEEASMRLILGFMGLLGMGFAVSAVYKHLQDAADRRLPPDR